MTTQTGAASTSSYKFTGREDDGSGLYYYRARYYQPRLQRFIAEDPLGFRGGDVNLYGYVSGNPVGLVDPLGLASLTTDMKMGKQHDEMGSLLVLAPLSIVTDPLNHTTTFGYDTKGNLTTITNALNKTTTLTVNADDVKNTWSLYRHIVCEWERVGQGFSKKGMPISS